MEQQEQQPQLKVDEKEISLIKQHFADNHELLKAIRAICFGLDVTDEEKQQVRELFSGEEMRRLFRKRLLPWLEKDTPIGQVADVWMGVENMVYGANEGTVYQAVQYKKKAIEMTEKALNLLENPDGEPMDVTFNPDKNLVDTLQTDLLARNMFIRHIESQLLFLSIIAGSKEETPEEAQKRLDRNSSQ